MNKQRRIALYDAWAPTYDRRLETNNAPLSFEGYAQVLSAALEWAHITNGMRVLDLGTGTGNLAAHFLDAGCDVWGLDFSARMLISAKKKLPQLHIVRANLTDHAWPGLSNRHFDRIVSSYALHDLNLANKIQLLGRLAKHNLAYQGRLVIADIAYPSQVDRARAQARWGRLWGENEHYWAADETITACHTIGLDCIYTQISSCAGLFVINKTQRASGQDDRPFVIVFDRSKLLRHDTPNQPDRQGETNMGQGEFQKLLDFFKVLGNESRLKIVGILANRECTVSDLADLLEVKEPTVSHHLAKLKELNLVHMQSDGNTHIYALNQDALVQMNRDLFSPQNMAALVKDVDEQSWEEKVLQTFVVDGRLTQIPARFKKRMAILNWLVEKFEFDRRYPEKELNAIIQEYHPDYASLRRYMIENKLMAREGGVYWRLPRPA